MVPWQTIGSTSSTHMIKITLVGGNKIKRFLAPESYCQCFSQNKSLRLLPTVFWIRRFILSLILLTTVIASFCSRNLNAGGKFFFEKFLVLLATVIFSKKNPWSFSNGKWGQIFSYLISDEKSLILLQPTSVCRPQWSMVRRGTLVDIFLNFGIDLWL